MDGITKSDKNAIVAVAIITAFATTFASSSLNLAIPAIGLEFHSSATMTGWIVTGYMLCVAMLSVPFGRIADMTGRIKILIIGIGVFSLTSGLAVLATSTELIVVLRVLQGIGAAMIFSTNVAILVSAFPPEKRGKILGYSVASTYVGLATGPVLGGFLTHYLGWRSVFIVSMLIGLVSFTLSIAKLTKIKNSKEDSEKSQKFNLLGNLLYISMIFCIMYGFSSFSENNIAKALIAVGICLGVLFVYHELRTDNPVVEVRLFMHNTSYLLSNMAALFNYGATFAVGYLLSLYLQLIMDFDSQIAGTIMICQPLIMAIVSPLAGRLSDRFSPFKLASLGMALCAVTLFSFTFLTVSSSLAHIIISLVIIGIGFGLFSSPNTNAVMSCVPAKDYSVASSILATMRSLGQTSSMAIITLIMSATLGKATFADASPKDLVDTMHTAFIVFSVICLIGVFISLQRKDRHFKKDKKS